jgi:quinol monooxygenase YgiN
MYVVSVEFIVNRASSEAFLARAKRQAMDSLENESECHQFDICADPSDNTRFFFYEVYTDAAAFAAHRKTAHFSSYANDTGDWVVKKTIQTWEKQALL